MKIVIRVDASVTIGSGHVMRCLTIAKKMRQAQCKVLFWMEYLKGNLIEFVVGQGFSVITKPEKADIYIVDHYALGIEWECAIRQYAKKVVVIDDLARAHHCDVLIDQNFLPNFEKRYIGKVPVTCKTLLGPAYLMIREEFIQARKTLQGRRQEIERLLIFMGGSDPTKETLKIVEALKTYTFKEIDVVVGEGNPFKEHIKHICAQQGYSYHCQIDYIASLMCKADFSLGAGGSTLWERCYVGLPSSSTIVAPNQQQGTIFAAEKGLTINVGWHEQVSVKTYRNLLNNLVVNNMSELGLELTTSGDTNLWFDELMELRSC